MSDSVSNSGLNPPSEILRTTNGGATWTSQLRDTTPGWFESLQFLNGTNGWVVSAYGKILHTTDGGTNWILVTNTGTTSSADNKAVFFLDLNNGWIGSSNPGIDNSVLHTTDGGTSWETESVPVQYSVFSISFIDAKNGWLSSDYGGIAHTTSGGEPTSVGEMSNSNVPNRFELAQNFPNPFNPSTIIQFTVPSNGRAVLKVFNTLGQEVATLFSDNAEAGIYHQVQFDAANLASGIYFSQLEFGGMMQVKKMLLLK